MAIIPRNKKRILSTALSLSFLTSLNLAQATQAQDLNQEESLGSYNTSISNMLTQDIIDVSQSKLHDADPATYPYYGNFRLRLPSVKLDVGANVPVMGLVNNFQTLSSSFTALSDVFKGKGTLSDSTTSKIQTDLTAALAPFQNGVRLDYDVDVSLLGFMFSPVQIGGRKLSLGFNVGGGTQSYAAINFSKEFSEGLTNIVNSLPEIAGLAKTASTLQSQASSLTQNATQLSATAAGLPNVLVSANGNVNTILAELDSTIQSLDDLISPANQISSDVDKAIKTGEGFIKTVNTLSKNEDGQSGISVDAVVDGHLTFALSGAYELLKSTDLTVSVGSNLKFFYLPYNTSLTSMLKGSQGEANLMGHYKLDDLKGIQDVTASVQSTVDGVKPTVAKFKDITQDVEGIRTSLTTLRTEVESINNATDVVDKFNRLNALATSPTVTQISDDSNSLIDGVNGTVTEANKAFNDLSNLQNNIKLDQLSATGNIVNPSNVGFGMDLSIDAFLLKNSLWVGLNLINPIVAWGATSKPFAIRGDGTLFVDDAKSEQVNYNASEPFGINLGTRYYFDQLLRGWRGLSVGGQFDFLANGRAPGLTLDAQQQLGPFYIGLGFRGGYISNLLMLKTGFRTAGPFGLDLGVGASPDLSGVMTNLGLYFQF